MGGGIMKTGGTPRRILIVHRQPLHFLLLAVFAQASAVVASSSHFFISSSFVPSLRPRRRIGVDGTSSFLLLNSPPAPPPPRKISVRPSPPHHPRLFSSTIEPSPPPHPPSPDVDNDFDDFRVYGDKDDDEIVVERVPSILLPENNESKPRRGILLVDPFSDYHSGYIIGRIFEGYDSHGDVGAVSVLSPYSARGLRKRWLADKGGDENEDGPLSLTAPLDEESLGRWLEAVPFPIVAVLCESDGGLAYAEALAEDIDRIQRKKGGGGGGGGLSMRHNGRNVARRDKYQMNESIRLRGVPTVRQALVSSEEEAARVALETFGVRGTADADAAAAVIVKPRRGVASDRVRLCRTLAQASDAARSILGTTAYGTHDLVHETALMQEYVPGVEYAIDAVSRNGVHKIASIWTYDKTSTKADGSDPFAYLCGRLVSSDDERHPVSKIAEYVEGCLDALDIQWGMTHTEVKLTSSGGDIRLMEVNVRQQNDHFGPLCNACVGYNALDLCLSAYLDDDDEGAEGNDLFELVPHLPTLVRHGMIVNLACYVDGIVTKINHIQEIEEMESVQSLSIHPGYSVGDRVQKTKDIRTDCGWVHLVHESEDKMMRDYDRICLLMPTIFTTNQDGEAPVLVN